MADTWFRVHATVATAEQPLWELRVERPDGDLVGVTQSSPALGDAEQMARDYVSGLLDVAEDEFELRWCRHRGTAPADAPSGMGYHPGPVF